MSQAALAQPNFLFGSHFLFDDDTVSKRDILMWDQSNSEIYDCESESTNSDYQAPFQVKLEDDDEEDPPKFPKGLNPLYAKSNMNLVPMFNVFTNKNYSFMTSFPRANDYSDQESILQQFPHLRMVNNPNFNINSVSKNAHFYLMRSSNDDNIHKAVKYNIWSTTTAGKTILSNAWKDFIKQGLLPEIYLIFSVVNTNHCLGIAKLTSDVNPNETFQYWWEPLKWFGTLKIQWVFLKDIHSSYFEHIKEDDLNASSFINLKDSTRLSFQNGKEIMKIFNNNFLQSNIFGSFAYMDQREDYVRYQRDSNASFQKQFKDACVAYQKDPNTFSLQKITQQNKKPFTQNQNAGQKNNNNKANNKNHYNKQNPKNQKNEPKKNNNNNNNTGNKNQSVQTSLAEQFFIKPWNKKSKNSKSQNTQKKDNVPETKQDSFSLSD